MALQHQKIELKGLFRYSSNKWNKALLEKGSIRVGTLYDYRKAEHKAGITDAYEGLKAVSHTISQWSSLEEVADSPSIHSRAIAALGLKDDVDKLLAANPNGVTFENVEIELRCNYPNVYIHCTSMALCDAVMAEFEGAQSCVEIFDIKGFYRALTTEINKFTKVQPRGINLVRYQDRNEVFNGLDLGVPPCWVKGKDFEGQFEVRAVWLPLDEGPIEPLFLEVPELADYCRPVRVTCSA